MMCESMDGSGTAPFSPAPLASMRQPSAGGPSPTLQLREEDLTLFKSDVSKGNWRFRDWKHMVATIKNLFWVRAAALLTRLA